MFLAFTCFKSFYTLCYLSFILYFLPEKHGVQQSNTDSFTAHQNVRLVQIRRAEPQSSVDRAQDSIIGGRWFKPWHGQYSFQGLMTVIATGFIHLSLLSIVSTLVVKWESSQWFVKNITQY